MSEGPSEPRHADHADHEPREKDPTHKGPVLLPAFEGIFVITAVGPPVISHGTPAVTLKTCASAQQPEPVHSRLLKDLLIG